MLGHVFGVPLYVLGGPATHFSSECFAPAWALKTDAENPNTKEMREKFSVWVGKDSVSDTQTDGSVETAVAK